MKRFTFNANTIAQLTEHWNLASIVSNCKVKAGFKTLCTQQIFKEGPRTLLDQVTNEVMREAYWSRKITQTASVIAISHDHAHVTTFSILSLYGKDNVACLPKEVAFEIVRLHDEGDHRATAFATAAKNWNEIVYAVRTNKDTLSEHMEKYSEQKKQEKAASEEVA